MKMIEKNDSSHFPKNLPWNNNTTVDIASIIELNSYVFDTLINYIKIRNSLDFYKDDEDILNEIKKVINFVFSKIKEGEEPISEIYKMMEYASYLNVGLDFFGFNKVMEKKVKKILIKLEINRGICKYITNKEITFQEESYLEEFKLFAKKRFEFDGELNFENRNLILNGNHFCIDSEVEMKNLIDLINKSNRKFLIGKKYSEAEMKEMIDLSNKSNRNIFVGEEYNKAMFNKVIFKVFYTEDEIITHGIKSKLRYLNNLSKENTDNWNIINQIEKIHLNLFLINKTLEDFPGFSHLDLESLRLNSLKARCKKQLDKGILETIKKYKVNEDIELIIRFDEMDYEELFNNIDEFLKTFSNIKNKTEKMENLGAKIFSRYLIISIDKCAKNKTQKFKLYYKYLFHNNYSRILKRAISDNLKRYLHNVVRLLVLQDSYNESETSLNEIGNEDINPKFFKKDHNGLLLPRPDEYIVFAYTLGITFTKIGENITKKSIFTPIKFKKLLNELCNSIDEIAFQIDEQGIIKNAFYFKNFSSKNIEFNPKIYEFEY